MANKTSTSSSASKKELSSIVSNMLAEQQKINERITALEQRQTEFTTSKPCSPEARIAVTDADMEKHVVRLMKEQGVYLSDATSKFIIDLILTAFIKEYGMTLSSQDWAIKALQATIGKHTQELEKLAIRVGKIEEKQERETQKVQPQATMEDMNLEDKIAKFIGQSIVLVLKSVFVFLMSILRVLWQIIAYLWHVIVGYFSDNYNSQYDYYGEQKVNRRLYWLVLVPALTTIFIYMIISCNSMP